MIKKLAFTLLCFLIPYFVMSVTVFSHSYLNSSYPEHGSLVEEEVMVLELLFDAGIEQTSRVEITNSSGEEFPIEEIVVESPRLNVLLQSPLRSDEYLVNWFVIGEDGHPTDGSFSFSVLVDLDEEEIIEEVEEQQEIEEIMEQNTQQPISEKVEETRTDQGPFNFLYLIIPLIAIGSVVCIVIYRRKG